MALAFGVTLRAGLIMRFLGSIQRKVCWMEVIDMEWLMRKSQSGGIDGHFDWIV